MRANTHLLFNIGFSLLAAISASPSYSLQNFNLGQGASNGASSTSYNVELNGGEVVSQPTSSLNYASKTGTLQAQQASIPPAPTVSNGGGSYYNKLGVIINTGGNATDATYALAISVDNFVTTNYIQIDGSVGSTPIFQTYTQWGGSGGTTIVGLAPSTTYEIKAAAMQGKFTQSAYGPFATIATTSTSISFSLSSNTLSLSPLLAGTVITSPTITASISTNANFGAKIYISDSNSGLKSLVDNHTIASSSVALGSFANGYGMQIISATQTSGGPLGGTSPFNSSGTTVGALSPTMQVLFSAPAAITGGLGNVTLLAKAAATDSSGSDYRDSLTFLTAASY